MAHCRCFPLCSLARREHIPISSKASRKATTARRTANSPGSQAQSGKERVSVFNGFTERGTITVPLFRSQRETVFPACGIISSYVCHTIQNRQDDQNSNCPRIILPHGFGRTV